MLKLKKSKIVACTVALCMLFMAMSFSVCAADTTFSDMPDNWATAALNKAVENGLLNGYDGKIMPEDCVTRSQMAAIMVRSFAASQMADISSFVDVSADAWYRDDMAKSVAMGIFKGDGENLNPDNNITREEAFTVLSRAFELAEGNESILADFKDKGDISDWAVPFVAAIVENGYAKGSNGYLNPKNNITRSEFAVLMDNIVKVYITEPGTYSELGEGNVMVRANDVKITGNVKGDLILGYSVEEKGVTLSGATVEGRIVNDANDNKVVTSTTTPGGGGSAGGGGSVGGGGSAGGSGSVGGGTGGNNGGNTDSGNTGGGTVDNSDGGIEDGGEL